MANDDDVVVRLWRPWHPWCEGEVARHGIECLQPIMRVDEGEWHGMALRLHLGLDRQGVVRWCSANMTEGLAWCWVVWRELDLELYGSIVVVFQRGDTMNHRTRLGSQSRLGMIMKEVKQETFSHGGGSPAGLMLRRWGREAVPRCHIAWRQGC